MLYSIADLCVSYDSLYPMLRERSEKYRIEESATPDLSLSVTKAQIDGIREATPLLDDETREYMLIGKFFYENLPLFGGMMLHASAVVVDSEAYLFSAPSGTGKSTHTSLWLRYFGDRAYILNDDKPAIRLKDGKVYAYGTPYSGKFDISRNIGVPLKGIAFVERSETNFVERMDAKKAMYSILNQTARPAAPQKYMRLLKVLDGILKNVPVYTLHCNMELEAAKVAYEAMQKGNES